MALGFTVLSTAVIFLAWPGPGYEAGYYFPFFLCLLPPVAFLLCFRRDLGDRSSRKRRTPHEAIKCFMRCLESESYEQLFMATADTPMAAERLEEALLAWPALLDRELTTWRYEKFKVGNLRTIAEGVVLVDIAVHFRAASTFSLLALLFISPILAWFGFHNFGRTRSDSYRKLLIQKQGCWSFANPLPSDEIDLALAEQWNEAAPSTRSRKGKSSRRR